MLGTTHPTTQCHIVEDLNPQARNCSDSRNTSPRVQQLSNFFLSKKEYGKKKMEYEAVYPNKISS
jgi:hypothetical protein